jgi:FkbM family methyltransferase
MPRINPRSDSYEALLWDVVTNAHRYQPKEGDWVLDLGAHFGMFALYCAARGASVVPIEPTPASFDELCHTERVAREIGKGLLFPRNIAAWDEECFLVMRARPETNASNSALRKEGDRYEVRALPLDQIIGPQHFDCIKCDIEGAELRVLKAFTKWKQCKFLSIEIHNDILSKEEVAELKALLREHFADIEILPLKSNPEIDVAWFCRNPR